MTVKIFLDTAVFIYFLEANPLYVDKVEKFLENSINNNYELITSTVTIMEFCTKPYELGNTGLISQFNDFLSILKITSISINEEIALEAAKLRGKYKSLKGMDSLQVASAIKGGCNKFISNDRKLKQITEINIELVEDF
jgi:predicted nucleic acid-binding protein